MILRRKLTIQTLTDSTGTRKVIFGISSVCPFTNRMQMDCADRSLAKVFTRQNKINMKSKTLLILTFLQLLVTAVAGYFIGGYPTAPSGILAFVLACLALTTRMREDWELRCKYCCGSGFRVNREFLTEACECQHETKI